MKKIDISQTVQTTANLGVLVGIFFLAYEIRQNTTATQLMASESHMASVIGQNDLLVTNPQLAELLARAIAGEEISDAEFIQLGNLMGSRLFAWQNSYLQYRQGAIPEEVMRGFDLAMVEWMTGLPIFRDYWESRTDRFAPDFVEYVRAVLPPRGTE